MKALRFYLIGIVVLVAMMGAVTVAQTFNGDLSALAEMHYDNFGQQSSLSKKQYVQQLKEISAENPLFVTQIAEELYDKLYVSTQSVGQMSKAEFFRLHRVPSRFDLWREAAMRGEANAQYELGKAYSLGEGVAKDDYEAVRWYRAAAEQGHASAQSRLGFSYDVGLGVTLDKREAWHWSLKATEQGDSLAQLLVNARYSNLDGNEEYIDWDKFMSVLHGMAEQGNEWAQFNLSYAYYYGKGIIQDRREAVRWSRKAAEQGDSTAQRNLGISYWQGEGVIEDDREAYIWWSIAKANGNVKAAENLHATDWQKYLSRAEIRSAQKEAARRLEAIENREKKTVSQPGISENIAVASAPKRANIAAHVFEQT